MTDFNLETAIIKSITVRCNIEAAFRIWTEKVDLWWPKDHLMSGEPNTQIFMEGQVGGRFYERTAEGTEYEWGQVTLWEPPYRLAYIWNRGSPVEQPTRIEVQFTVIAPDRTRVDVEHRGPEYVGELWYQTSPGYRAAWAEVLPAYVSACDKAI